MLKGSTIELHQIFQSCVYTHTRPLRLPMSPRPKDNNTFLPESFNHCLFFYCGIQNQYNPIFIGNNNSNNNRLAAAVVSYWTWIGFSGNPYRGGMSKYSVVDDKRFRLLSYYGFINFFSISSWFFLSLSYVTKELKICILNIHATVIIIMCAPAVVCVCVNTTGAALFFCHGTRVHTLTHRVRYSHKEK